MRTLGESDASLLAGIESSIYPSSGPLTKDGAMTRREFAGLLAFMLPAAIDNQHTIRHIGNRRLFDFTAGAIKLDEQEREHLHQCGMCQKTALAFLQSAT